MRTVESFATLGLIHATIVVTAALAARWCIPRCAADRRARVGAAGLLGVLLVTVLSTAPVPGILGGGHGTERDLETHVYAVDDESPDARSAAASGSVAGADESASRAQQPAIIALPSGWLEQLRSRMQQTESRVSEVTCLGRRVIVGAVVAGISISFARLLLALRAVSRLRKESVPIESTAVATTITRLSVLCECRREIEVRESRQLLSASVCGWRCPRILLPRDWRCWSPDELNAVLAHEVAHVRRGDYALRMIAHVGAAMHFYHPLVRTACRWLATDQEFAADQLAGRLTGDSRGYARALARLALRYHDAINIKDAWPRVSVMPRSSDYLARRLEMLRTHVVSQESVSRKSISRLALLGVVVVAAATTLLRGAAVEDKPAGAVTAPIEVARRETEQPSADDPVQPTSDSNLFGRAAFDPAMLRTTGRGGFLIRVGDFLRHPEMQQDVEKMNQSVIEMLQDLIGPAADKIDIREIEWIAGNLLFSVRSPAKKGEQGRYMLGSGGMIIRTARAVNWQEETLQGVPGATLKTFDGKNYVQLPSMPALGPAPVRMRFPNDRTIVYGIGTVADTRDQEAEAKFLRAFLDDAPRPCPWASTWRAVDGGLVTVVVDNSTAGWEDLPPSEKPWSKTIAPLIEKTKYFAIGLDWTEKENRTGLRIRATCDDAATVPEVHLAAMTVLSYWPAAFVDAGDFLARYQRRILQFFSSIEVRPSQISAEDHYVEASADVGWETGEFIEVLRRAWGSAGP